MNSSSQILRRIDAMQEANRIATELGKRGAPQAVVSCVRAQAVPLRKARAVLEAYSGAPSKPPARAARHEPPKPTTRSPKDQPMTRAQIAAVEGEHRRAFFEARPHLPDYLKTSLRGEPMSRVRRVAAAFEGAPSASGSLRGVVAALTASLDDPKTPAGERRRALAALKTFEPSDLPAHARARIKQASAASAGLTLEQIQRTDPTGWQLGCYEQVASACVSDAARISLGVPLFKKRG